MRSPPRPAGAAAAGSGRQAPPGGPLPLTALPRPCHGDTWETRVSRFLQQLLRHRAEATGIETDRAGWARLSDVLALRCLRDSGVTRDLVLAMAENRVPGCSLRLQVREFSGWDQVRAIQGHSMDHIAPEAVGTLVLPSETVARVLIHSGPWHSWQAGRYRRGLLPGTFSGLSRRPVVYLSPDPSRHADKLREGADLVAIQVCPEAMHRHGLRLFRTARGDIMTPDIVPASCFVAASHWEGGQSVQVWNAARDGPLRPWSPEAAVAPGQRPVRLAPAAGTAAPIGDLVTRCRQLPWNTGAERPGRSRSPPRGEARERTRSVRARSARPAQRRSASRPAHPPSPRSRGRSAEEGSYESSSPHSAPRRRSRSPAPPAPAPQSHAAQPPPRDAGRDDPAAPRRSAPVERDRSPGHPGRASLQAAEANRPEAIYVGGTRYERVPARGSPDRYRAPGAAPPAYHPAARDPSPARASQGPPPRGAARDRPRPSVAPHRRRVECTTRPGSRGRRSDGRHERYE